jgi:serine/threonine protein kinase
MQLRPATVRKQCRASSSVVVKVSSKLWQRASRSFRTAPWQGDGERDGEPGQARALTPTGGPHKVPETVMAEAPPAPSSPELSLGSRYRVYGEIASGGMAVVQYGRLAGPGGFARGVAIKRLHAQFARDPNFVSMFLDEARLSARVQHANVVPTIDVLSQPGEISVVMEYVLGESLSGLLAIASARGEAVPVRVAATLLAGTLHGLHAAHETCGEHDEPLNIVHRDVSPQNILVGSDGVARLLDFGIAKAQGRSRMTPTGELKGKLAYMACEQYRGEEADRRVDVYGASVVLWETLTGCMLFDGPNDAAVARAVMNDEVRPPSHYAPHVPEALDRIVLRGLSRERDLRYATAREMALALEREVGVVAQSEVSDWVHGLAGDLLAARAEAVRQMQRQVESQPVRQRDTGSQRAVGVVRDTPRPSFDSAERETSEGGTRRIEDFDSGQHRRPTSDPAFALAATRTAEALGSETLYPPRAKRRSVLVAALVLLGLIGVGTVGALSLRDAAGPHAGQASETPSSVPTPPPLPVPLPAARLEPKLDPAMAEAPAPDEGVSPQPAEDARAQKPDSATVSDAAQDPDERPKRRGTRNAEHGETSRKERAGKKPGKEVDCSQPVVVDAMGIRRVKRECL